MKNACALQSENIRWAHSVAQYHEQESTLCGDVLLTAAFISYAGSFSKRYRHELLHNLWMPYLRAQKVCVCLRWKLFVLSTDIVIVLKMCIVSKFRNLKEYRVQGN